MLISKYEYEEELDSLQMFDFFGRSDQTVSVITVYPAASEICNPTPTMFRIVLLLLVTYYPFVAASFNPQTYSLTDSTGDHTGAGKYYDRQGDIDQSIASFRAACQYSGEPTNFNNLGLALISIKRAIPREDALREGITAFERALWYDRENAQAWANFESTNKQLKRYEWSGESGRKRFLKKVLAAPKVLFPKKLKSILEINSLDEFWNFLSSDLFQLNIQ